MNLDGRAIANFVLDICEAKGRDITNLSLQKILFFCHAWHLVALKKPLIKHQFEAWQYGPVLQYVYREFKDYESKPIRTRATRLDVKTGRKEVVPYEMDETSKVFLQQVIDFYSRLTANELLRLSHMEGGPWERVWHHQGSVNPGMRIDNALIEQHFRRVDAHLFSIH